MDKTIEIDDALIRAAQDATGESDERVAVETVLRQEIRRLKKLKALIDFAGSVEFRDDFDSREAGARSDNAA